MKVFSNLKRVISVLSVMQFAPIANANDYIDNIDRLKVHIDKCKWLDSNNKNLFRALPPFRHLSEKVIEYVEKTIQPESEINLEQAKSDAKNFFSKYLNKMPDLLDIAKNVLENGTYRYVDFNNWMLVAGSQMQAIMDDDDGWSDTVDKFIQLLMEGKTKNDIITQCMPFLKIGDHSQKDQESLKEAEKLIDEIEHKYLDFSKISKNFEINVIYTNQKNLLITAIHETGHVLDYAYRVRYNKRTETLETDLEAFAILFETIAKRDFDATNYEYDILRLLAPYAAITGFDILLKATDRINNSCNDIDTLEQIRDEVENDWKSPVAEIMDLGISNGNILEFVHLIRTGEKLEIQTADHLRQMIRFEKLLAHEHDIVNKMPEIMERLVTESTKSLTGEEYLDLYNKIVI